MDLESKFWQNFDLLLTEKNKNYSSICKELGISNSTLSSWRINNTLPRADIAVKIAELLDTTTEYLVSGKNPQITCEPIKNDLLLISKELAKIINKIE